MRRNRAERPPRPAAGQASGGTAIKAAVLAALLLFGLAAIGLKAALPLLWVYTQALSVPDADKAVLLAAASASSWLKPVAYAGAALVSGIVFARLARARTLAEAALYAALPALLCAVEGNGLAGTWLLGGATFLAALLGTQAGMLRRNS